MSGGVVRGDMTDGATDVDTDALASYLSAALDEAVVDASVLHDGLNLTITVSTREEPDAYVVRRPSKRRHRDLFSDLRQEFRLLQALEPTAIDTPAPVHYCDDPSIIGDEFYAMTSLDGTSITWDAPLPERYRSPEARRHLAGELVDALAAIHSLAADRFEGACTRRSPAAQLDRALDRLDAATAVTGHEVPRLRDVAERLRAVAPVESRTSLVHGDFQPYNVFFAGRETPEITGVFDWETALLGDPFTELGYLLLTWRDESDPRLPLDDIEATHPDGDAIDRVRTRNETGFFPWTTDPGSPTRRALLDRYESRTGFSLDDVRLGEDRNGGDRLGDGGLRDDRQGGEWLGGGRYYRAHAAVTFATVWEDLYRHQVESDRIPPDEAADWEPHVEYVALMAEHILDGNVPL